MGTEAVMGWDVGGAHLKGAYVDAHGRVVRVFQLPCPLWQGMAPLSRGIQEIREAMEAAPAVHAVTMTGEMADLFEDRDIGVRSLTAVMQESLDGATLWIYAGRAGFLGPEAVVRDPAPAASANWHASAAYAAHGVEEGLFVDVGSTTTDIVPFRDRAVRARGHTDRERMAADELVYTGVVRTPVMVLADRIPFRGGWLRVMAERFASTADVYRLAGGLPAHADLLPSADGGGKGVADSARRLARMLGCDGVHGDLSEWRRVAGFLAERQLGHIRDACECVLSRGVLGEGAPLVGAGVGRFVVRTIAGRMGRPYLDFGALLPAQTMQTGLGGADCAPAVTVALLARRRLRAQPVEVAPG